MKVEDIMETSFVSFRADDSVEFIVRAFAKERIISAPVLDGEEYLGIVSELGLAEYFAPKKFLPLWKKSAPTPMSQIRKVTAAQLARKSSVTLKPGDNLASAIPKIVKRPYCIAVLDGKKLVGVVRGVDITNFFLKEFAKDSTRQDSPQEGEGMQTEVDQLYEIVRRHGAVRAKDAARELGISVPAAEKLANCLANHHLVEIRYSFFDGAIIKKRLGYEKK